MTLRTLSKQLNHGQPVKVTQAQLFVNDEILWEGNVGTEWFKKMLYWYGNNTVDVIFTDNNIIVIRTIPKE
ncbi:MAG: hypothetical protein MJZ37_06395 [Bacilli bacterium]|nr:hypothetical protein [Bacilli bacterium]